MASVGADRRRTHALAGLGLTLAGFAPHDPGLSSAAIRREPEAVIVVATFNRKELAQVVEPDDANAMQSLFASGYEIRVDGKLLTLAAVEARALLPLDTEVTLRFALAPSASATAPIEVSVPLLTRLDKGHRHHLAWFRSTVQGNVASSDPRGRGLPVALLDRDHLRATLDLATTQTPQARFIAFLQLGTEHVLTGYDHVLFLLALLLVGLPLWTTLGVITAFTLSHSLTLGLAALDLVCPPSTLVEPLIAATIVYVGLENLLVHAPRRRWLLASGFGLIHGFGFAAALREVGIGSGSEAVLPLCAFNLGVEVGQAAIAVVAVPMLLAVHRFERLRRPVLVIGSLITCGLGAWWLFERTVLA